MRRKVRLAGAEFNLHMTDGDDDDWFIDVSGASFANPRGGLRRTDTLWKALGRALVFSSRSGLAESHRLLLLTSHPPRPGSEGDRALRAVGPGVVFDVVAMLDEGGQERLAEYAGGGYSGPKASRLPPRPGYWTEEDIAAMDPELA